MKRDLSLLREEVTPEGRAYRVLAGKASGRPLVVCLSCGVIGDSPTLIPASFTGPYRAVHPTCGERNGCRLQPEEANVGYFVEIGCRALCGEIGPTRGVSVP